MHSQPQLHDKLLESVVVANCILTPGLLRVGRCFSTDKQPTRHHASGRNL